MANGLVEVRPGVSDFTAVCLIGEKLAIFISYRPKTTGSRSRSRMRSEVRSGQVRHLPDSSRIAREAI